MPKILKSQVIFLIITGLFFCVFIFLFEPTIKEKYLDSDLSTFKDDSWKYTIIPFIFLLIVYLFLIIKSKRKDFSNLPLVILFLTLGCFGLRGLIDKFLLYVNTQTEKEKVVRIYEVINHKEQQVFWLKSKTFIHSDNEIDKINNYRIKKNLKSVFELKTNDTIIVTLKRGIMDVSYLD
ncbi:hypothetical protein [Chryseobacterium populi]|uniref:Uncharacterized protein n=1 Tax=Chryseobacterium populi TaxID=1144316 RepID=J3CHR9_9FLAO|nr:hypothetical protein [Chryseobacterium populi]EJL71874.1 hypothetical protein PMI13_02211 [Chryseobacterium populi]